MRGEALEVEQLADRAAPAGEQDLVEGVRVARGRGPRLEAGLVPGHGREPVPEPAEHGLGPLDAAEVVRDHGLVREDGGAGLGGVGRHEAGADEEDVAEADRGVLGGEARFEVRERDREGFEGVVGGGGAGGGGLGETPAVVVD